MNPDPKPPRLWSTVLTRWAMLLVLGVALVIALRPKVGTWLAGAKKAYTSGDPADVRLVGVVPDGDNILLDPRGRPLAGARFEWSGERPLTWSAQQMQRDLLFELGPGTETLQWLPGFPGSVSVSGNRGWANPHSIRLEETTTPDGRRQILVQLGLNENYWGRTALFGSGRKLLHEVDFDLRYFTSQRGRAQLNFEGPFIEGQTKSSREKQAVLLIALTNAPNLRADSATFRTWRNSTGPWAGLQALAYDTEGKRHATSTRFSTSGPFGFTNEFVVDGVPLSRVKAITFGEESRVKTFHNIVVRYPDRPTRDHSPVLDRLAAALGQTNMPPNAIEHFSPRTAQDAVTKLEFIPGNRTAMSWLAYSSSTTNFSELNPAQREKVRQFATAWTRGSDSYKRTLGLKVGLRGGWPEFTALALERLRNSLPQERLDTTAALASHPNGLDRGDLPFLVGLVQSKATPGLGQDMSRVILRIGGPAATNALLELSRAESPITWWSAIRRVHTEAFGRVEDLDEEMRQRLWMVKGLTNISLTPASLTAAQARLTGLLSLETRALSYTVFEEVLQTVGQRLDRAAATDVLTRYLRSGASDAWQRFHPSEIIQKINEWYDQDFGGLGNKKKPRSDYPVENAWPGLVEEVLEFCDKVKQGKTK